MASQNVVRPIETLSWVDSSQLRTVDIPRNLDIKGLMIRITGSVTVAGANATSVKAWWTNVIRRVQLVVGGQQSIIDAKFVDLVLGNFQRNFETSYTAPSSANIGTYPFSATAILDLQNIDGLRPTDSNLHTRGLSLLQLIIDTGSAADMFVVGPATVSVDNTTQVFISAMESIEDDAGYAESRFIRKISQQTRTVDAANTDFKVPLSRGGLLRAILVRCEVDGAPSEVLVTNLKFASGVDVRYNLPWADTKVLNRMNYNRNSTDQDGIAVIDLAPDKQMTRNFNLAAVTEADAIFSVLAPGASRTIHLTIFEFLAPPAASPSK